MRLSTSTNIYFNRPDGRKASIRESMQRCHEAGYKVMDLNFHDCVTFKLPFITSQWQYWLEDIVGLGQSLDIIFNQAHAPFYNFCDSSIKNSKNIDELIFRAVDCCKSLGIPWLVIHAGTDFGSATPVCSSFEKNRAYFLPVLEYAEKSNVGIAFENLWECNIAPLRRYTSNAEELIALVDSFHGARVGVCWDTDHAALMGQDQCEALSLVGSRLVATHICDCINNDADHMLPFSGSIEWEPIMRTLGKIGYKGDLTYEIHRYTSTMPDDMVEAALKYSVQVGNYLLRLATGKQGE